MEMFDLKTDAHEKNNLLASFSTWPLSKILEFSSTISRVQMQHHTPKYLLTAGGQVLDAAGAHSRHEDTDHSRIDFELTYGLQDRSSSTLHMLLVSKLYQYMLDFVRHGDEAYRIYLNLNPGRHYNVTAESDQHRMHGNNVYRFMSAAKSESVRKAHVATLCSSACSCDTLPASAVPSLPFNLSTHLPKKLEPGSLPSIPSLFHI
jgi:hypothetical protein